VRVLNQRTTTWWIALALVGAALGPAAPPVGAHAGTADGSRPFVTGLEPALPGIAVSAVFAGDWQVNLSVVNGETVSVLDEAGRPFVRIGRDGVEGDYGAASWFTTAVAPKGSGLVKLPEGVGPDAPPDWRLVSRSTSWAWFDPRIRTAPGLVTPDLIRQAVPARLADVSIPLRIGDRGADIKGYLEFEPPKGNYRHRLLRGEHPAPGVEVGLLAGQAVPTFKVRNDSGQEVTVLGTDREPFLRIGSVVEANLASPTWVQIGRALGRTPKTVADPAAEPQWERIAEGQLMSWTDFRSRPPDNEPPAAVLQSGRAVEVRRWTIPLRLGSGSQAAEISGVTEFEPFRPPGHQADNTSWLVAAAAGALLVGATALVALRRRGSRSLQ
jgi:hypothetical protein